MRFVNFNQTNSAIYQLTAGERYDKLKARGGCFLSFFLKNNIGGRANGSIKNFILNENHHTNHTN